jgi:hypothetical protein
MRIIEKIKFLLNGSSIKELTDKAYKKGYDKCHNEAMKYLIKESK